MRGAVVDPQQVRNGDEFFKGDAWRTVLAHLRPRIDIGFNLNGTLKSSDLVAFANGGNVYVTSWYDQSSGNHVIQSNKSYQPRIVSTGTFDNVNGLPAIYLKSSLLVGPLAVSSYPNTLIGVVSRASNTNYGAFMSIGADNGPGVGLGNFLSSSSTTFNFF